MLCGEAVVKRTIDALGLYLLDRIRIHPENHLDPVNPDPDL